MASVQSFDDIVNRISGGYSATLPMWGEIQTASTANVLASTVLNGHRVGDFPTLPTLPSGVTAYIPTAVWATSTTASLCALIGKGVDLGSINIATPTFTDGSAMPTVTEGGTSRATSSIILCEVTTALNATPGSLQITYTDQDGNGGAVTTSAALTASSAARSIGFPILASGDTGVTDITAATRTGGTTPTGVIKFWGVIPLAIVPVAAQGAQVGEFATRNILTASPNILRLGASDTIITIVFGSNAVKAVTGGCFVVGDS